jgi:hypothetical protein
MSNKNSIVAVYETHTDAGAGVKELQKAAFDMTTLSVVGRECHAGEQIIGHYNSSYGMKYWGKMEAFWGGLWGFLAGAAFFELPTIGPVLIAGPISAAVVAALEHPSDTSGVSALGAGFLGLGMPKNQVVHYEAMLMADRFLLVAHGLATELMRAKAILRITRPDELNLHFAEEEKNVAVQG